MKKETNEIMNELVQTVSDKRDIVFYTFNIVDADGNVVLGFGHKFSNIDELEKVLKTILETTQNVVESNIALARKTSVSTEQMEENSAAATPRTKSLH